MRAGQQPGHGRNKRQQHEDKNDVNPALLARCIGHIVSRPWVAGENETRPIVRVPV